MYPNKLSLSALRRRSATLRLVQHIFRLFLTIRSTPPPPPRFLTLFLLYQAGFGKLDTHALERSAGGGQSLLNAQAAAKAAKAGMWSIEPTEAEIKVRKLQNAALEKG